MPAARYWRVVGLETYGGGDLELSGLHLYSASGRVDASATLTSSHAPDAGTLAALQDADDATVCGFAGAKVRASGFWQMWDFGGSPADVRALRIGSGATLAKYLVRCILQYHDGAGWVGLRTVPGGEWPGAFALAGIPGDPDFTYSVLRLHADVPVGSTTAPDTSQYGSTASRVGGASIVSLSGAFGNAFHGAGSAWSVPSAARFDLRLQDFKLECLIRPMGTSSDNQGLVVRDAIGGSRGWLLYLGDGTGGSTARAVSFALWSGGAAIALHSNFVPPVGVDTHIAVTRWEGIFKLWINGALAVTLSTALTFDSPASTLPITIGALALTAGYSSPFNGTVDEVDLTIGRAVFTAPFTPRSFPLQDFEGSAQAITVPVRARRTSIQQPFAGYDIGGGVMGVSTGLQRACRDLEFGGIGRVRNTVKEKGAPDTPVRRRVRLMRERDGLVVREQWSDPATGAYDFQFVDERQAYTVLSYDHTLDFRAVIADGLTLANGTVELMP